MLNGIFLSTPSARRATPRICEVGNIKKISIHALCEEGDCSSRATVQPQSYFYPRPLRGGRHAAGLLRNAEHHISIHALCEEGDPPETAPELTPPEFLSTPSARRATRQRRPGRHQQAISIHALCEEGDADAQAAEKDYKIFLSTPSARRATLSTGRPRPRPCYFYPRPLRGGRPGPSR